MSSSRQRMINALNFNFPDKIPVIYHSSPAGLYVHGEKLLELFRQYPPDNPIEIDSIPSPPAETVDEDGNYHENRKDEWGTTWKYRIFGVHGHPLSYPFSCWEKSLDYMFPRIVFTDETFKQRIRKLKNDFLVFDGWISIFEKLHALQPFENVLMDIYDRNKHFINFLDRLVEYRKQQIDALIDAGVDVIIFGDDWGTQTAPFISPEHFNTIFKPRYEYLIKNVKQSDKKIFFHSCGQIGYIFHALTEMGIDGLWPQISLYDFDKFFEFTKKTYFIYPSG